MKKYLFAFLMAVIVSFAFFTTVAYAEDSGAKTGYQVEYDLNGGDSTNNVSSYPTSFIYGGRTIVLPVPTKSGYKFEGWYNLVEDGYEDDYAGFSYENYNYIDGGYYYDYYESKRAYTQLDGTIKDDLYLYAKWSREVKFDGNGATSGSMNPIKTYYDRYYNDYERIYNKYKKSGYEFWGWNTKADGSGKSYEDEIRSDELSYTNGTVKLYAQWVNKPVVKLVNKAEGVKISWSRCSWAEGYKIYKDYKCIKTFNNNRSLSYIDESVFDGNDVCYSVVAYKGKITQESDEKYITFLKKPVIKLVSCPPSENDDDYWYFYENGVGIIKTDGSGKSEVYRKEGSNGAWKKIMTDVYYDELIDKNVKSGKTYYYKLKTVDDGSSSVYSNPKRIKYLEQPAITCSYKEDKSYNYIITVKWSAVPGASGYYVYKGDTKVKTIKNPKKTVYTIKTADKNYYSVMAYSGSYKGAESESIYPTESGSKDYYEYDSKRSGLSASNVSNGIKVTWSGYDYDYGYYVYRKTGSGNYKKIATIKNNRPCSYTDKKAVNGMKYTYLVKAYVEKSTLSYNSFTIVRLTLPRITGISSPASGKIKVTWKKNSKASGYQVQYSEDKYFGNDKISTLKSARTVSKTLSTYPGDKYYVRVRSYKTVSGKKHYSGWSPTKAVVSK